MQSIRLARSITLSTTDPDILRNTNVGFAERPSMVNVYGVQETAVDDIQITVSIGQQQVLLRSDLPLRAGAGPNKPDDLLAQAFAPAGSKIQIDLFNTDAAATRVARIAVDVQPVA